MPLPFEIKTTHNWRLIWKEHELIIRALQLFILFISASQIMEMNMSRLETNENGNGDNMCTPKRRGRTRKKNPYTPLDSYS